MKRWFHSLRDSLYWEWDTETQSSRWVDSTGRFAEPSGFSLETGLHYLGQREVSRLPNAIPDIMRVSEGL